MRDTYPSIQPPPLDKRSGPLRIVHIVSSLNIGGMEQFVLRIAEAQQIAGHQVSILAIREGGSLKNEASCIGINTHTLGGGRMGRVARGVTYLARRRPEIVHVHNLASLQYGCLAKRISRSRLVVTLHGRLGSEAAASSVKTWRSTDAIVAVSEATAVTYRLPEIADRMFVIRNGVQATVVRRGREIVRKDLGIDDHRLVGIIVARIDGRKGHDTILQALASLRNSNVPITVLVAGDGGERDRLEGLALQSGLGPEWVRFLGFRADIPDLLNASDFFLLPSISEGMPLSMLEAMAHHLPVLATPVGGIPEVLEHDIHGLIIPVSDPSALSDAMAILVDKPGFRCAMGEAAYTRVQQAFSFEKMTQLYEDLYWHLHRRHAPGWRWRPIEADCQGFTAQ